MISHSILFDVLSDAGLHPHIKCDVVDFEWLDAHTLYIQLKLHFQKAHPICCAELGCPMPAFTPNGFRAMEQAIQNIYQKRRTPQLKIEAMLCLEDGFEFRDEPYGNGWRTQNGTVYVYESAEML